MLHSKESVLKWIEGSVIGYMYRRTPSSTLISRLQKARTEYGITKDHLLRLIEAIEERHDTYFGGRYRLAFAVIAKKPSVASFRDRRRRAELIASLREIVQKT